MIFFDYLYYLCCRFYRRYRDEQDLDTWRISGVLIFSLLAFLFIVSMVFSITIFSKIDIDSYQTKSTIGGLFLLALLVLLSAIRYNKFMSYKEIALKVEEYSPTKIWVLDIAVVIYIFLGAPLTIILAVLRHNMEII